MTWDLSVRGVESCGLKPRPPEVGSGVTKWHAGAMDFMTAVRTCFHKFVDFDGRASRSEFWWFYLFAALLLVAAYVVQIFFWVLAAAFRDYGSMVAVFSVLSFGTNFAVFALAVALAIPLLAVGCRRLHDRGQSGWLQLLMLVPCGSLVLLVMWVLEGTPGPNPWGPPPGEPSPWAPPPAGPTQGVANS
jgi:uncharacterized membrane protein YhaH (DUF805 family)